MLLLTGSEVPLRSFAARLRPCVCQRMMLLVSLPPAGGAAARTLITLARSTRPGLTSLMVRLGLTWLLVGMLLTEVVLLLAVFCLSRFGSESLDVNAGRGIVERVDVAAAAPTLGFRVCRSAPTLPPKINGPDRPRCLRVDVRCGEQLPWHRPLRPWRLPLSWWFLQPVYQPNMGPRMPKGACRAPRIDERAAVACEDAERRCARLWGNCRVSDTHASRG